MFNPAVAFGTQIPSVTLLVLKLKHLDCRQSVHFTVQLVQPVRDWFSIPTKRQVFRIVNRLLLVVTVAVAVLRAALGLKLSLKLLHRSCLFLLNLYLRLLNHSMQQVTEPDDLKLQQSKGFVPALLVICLSVATRGCARTICGLTLSLSLAFTSSASEHRRRELTHGRVFCHEQSFRSLLQTASTLPQMMPNVRD